MNTTATATTPTRPPLQTVKQVADNNPAFTIPSLRWLLFHRATNGLDACTVKIGKRVLIDPVAFEKWQIAQVETKR